MMMDSDDRGDARRREGRSISICAVAMPSCRISCRSMIMYSRRLFPFSNGPFRVLDHSQGRKPPAGEEAMQELSGIRAPHGNDVLMGRGGKNNQHFGNETFRVLARERVEAYRRATKQGKSLLSRELVNIMRAMDPPAR